MRIIAYDLFKSNMFFESFSFFVELQLM